MGYIKHGKKVVYISLLRGINVSGQKSIKMEALRRLYEGLGFQNVSTYVQSGNVIFTHEDADTDQLEGAIARKIEKEFAFAVTVLVLTAEKLGQVIDNNPFVKESGRLSQHLYVTFLSAKPENHGQNAILTHCRNGEEVRFGEHAVYLYVPKGYGRTKINNNFVESRLKVNATTRNWKTTNELFKLAKQINPVKWE